MMERAAGLRTIVSDGALSVRSWMGLTDKAAVHGVGDVAGEFRTKPHDSDICCDRACENG
ncbi:MAG TPA: hypothetical protein VMW16_04120 [Sedimentisphaerales bacterium]|nr:hypothetical protein [Sedimentisphaerales bacterium]